jgi:uncharacterized membrane protein
MGDEQSSRDEVAGVRHLLHQLEDVVARSQQQVAGQVEAHVVPAWKRVTEGEPRWQVSIGVLIAVLLQVTLPDEVVVRPRWFLPLLAVIVLIGVIVANPRRINRESKALRVGSMVVIAIISLSNAWSAGHLAVDLIQGNATGDAPRLLLTGGAIWATNVIAFALWYWELDRGGPVARAQAVREHPDFMFVQMQSPELAPPDWEPGFADYLYLSFTNAAAFSPTDVLPLSRWSKMTMMLQAIVSLTTVALVVARAVNTLR